MAYEVTATRRRPKTFNELAGQDFIVATLKSSIESGRIAHAYLFSGPRGCGKTSAARILARSLNCEKGPTITPCGDCPSCKEIARGASLDVLEIDGASNTGVNDVRQIKDEVLFPPNSGRYKVYIIDEVHMLSNAAFNALLKTIEEPPPYIIFIFATTEIHKVPATIKSRCQQFQFRLIPIEAIKAILAATSLEMGLQSEDEALFWIAKESTGSLRDAYTLFDQVAAFSGGKINTELIRQKLGLIGLDAINTLAEACALGDTAKAFADVDGILQSGISIEQFVIDLVEYFRSLLLIKNGVTRESILGHNSSRYSKIPLEKFNTACMEQALTWLLNLYRDIRYSVSPRFDLECVISRLCWLDHWISPFEISGIINEIKTTLFDPNNDTHIRKAAPIVARSEDPSMRLSEKTSASDIEQPLNLSESFKQFMATHDEGHSSSKKSLPEIPETILEASEKSTIIPITDLSNLRTAAIKQLQKDRAMLASGLEKSGLWTMDGDTLAIPVADNLTAELLRKDHSVLISTFLTLTGTRYLIDITEAQKTPTINPKQEAESEIPTTVENVRRLFRGTIVQSDEQTRR